MLHEDLAANRDLADAPAFHGVAMPRHVHRPDSTIGRVSAPGIFGVPPAVNEPVKTYAPGSPERAELHRRLAADADDGHRGHTVVALDGQADPLEIGLVLEHLCAQRHPADTRIAILDVVAVTSTEEILRVLCGGAGPSFDSAERLAARLEFSSLIAHAEPRSDSDPEHRKGPDALFGVLVLEGIGLGRQPETYVQIASIPEGGIRELGEN